MSMENTGSEALVTLPVAAPAPAVVAVSPLIERLVAAHGAVWLDAGNSADWCAGAGDRVVFLAGDAQRFPEGLDVAVVLPELQRSFPGRFALGVATRAHEDALAKRYGSIRWPALLFLRDGQYVTVLSGMLDWDVYVDQVGRALEMPASRAPTVGIPVRMAGAASPSDSSCH
ncbi:MAG: hydrogenase [Gammaproteobacteria bacterium]|jgi:hydrogenase-1 operon protein HyaE|nr:hydrogenase [Gammaproteobacteria bacterium]MBU0772655.1 hydrogenase [Gammaproteobacteria bacterium]MBU0856860.1 hydrogenase [Gammaproteobacteria bacterium]MBU1846418.1 hydrogenase [Gammaproteobacteria bacterium]